MTQAPPDRLGRIESVFERIDRKLDAIAADLVELKISQGRMEERFNAIDQRFDSVDQRFNSVDQRLDSLEERLKSQDNRIWGLIAGVVLALFGLLAKMAFFGTGFLTGEG